ncbi:hypothetical protein GGR21_000964 [Dysgonomonas hofstadii]|uniref:Lipoprotein n=1 Tax=Dysgonomonas hofstadii TaxID=637886 RepID=A0A840CQ50_9BACT|nr:hypothetical protein [Dysgonomonas hofstadii]MBB4035075.1 hypothetical protein [Dysgonomonas hofstadii]
MKKLVLFAVAIVAISFASCGGSKPSPEEEQKRIQDSIARADSIAKVEAEAALQADSLAKVQAVLDSIAALEKK